MLLLNGLIGFGAFTDASAATITYTANANSTSDLSEYTFSTQALGTAATGRRVIVGIYSNNTSATITAVTVAGTSASEAVVATNSGGRAAIWIAQVDSGTTGDIVVTHSAGQQRCAIVVWAAYGLNSSTATATQTDTTGDPVNVSINIQAGGVVVGVCGANNAASNVAWTGLDEDADSTVETVPYSGASRAFATAQTGHAVSADLPGTPVTQALAVAAFR